MDKYLLLFVLVNGVFEYRNIQNYIRHGLYRALQRKASSPVWLRRKILQLPPDVFYLWGETLFFQGKSAGPCLAIICF